jgi:hypothetical protein
LLEKNKKSLWPFLSLFNITSCTCSRLSYLMRVTTIICLPNDFCLLICSRLMSFDTHSAERSTYFCSIFISFFPVKKITNNNVSKKTNNKNYLFYLFIYFNKNYLLLAAKRARLVCVIDILFM